MIRPSMQFYPRDWLAHPGLRMCSLAARGLWIDMVALMHSGEPYGYLNHKGKDILPPVLARIVGESIGLVEGYLSELKEHGVVSQSEDGALFSGRMVRDEQSRQARAAGGVKSLENPNVPRPKVDGEGYPSTHPPRVSIRPSPASAVASASAKKPPAKERGGWVARFGVPYSESSGGIAPLGEIGRHCKPLVDRDGEEPTFRRWAAFCASDKRQFGAAYFAKNAGDFDPGKRPTLVGLSKEDRDAIQYKKLGYV